MKSFIIQSRQSGKKIEAQMAAALLREGVEAEVTLCRLDMFSVLTSARRQHDAAKAVFSQVGSVSLDSEDVSDEELGFIAYYRF